MLTAIVPFKVDKLIKTSLNQLPIMERDKVLKMSTNFEEESAKSYIEISSK